MFNPKQRAVTPKQGANTHEAGPPTPQIMEEAFVPLIFTTEDTERTELDDGK